MKVRCRWERRWLVRDNHYQGAAVASCGVELPHYIKCTHHPQIERMPGACHGGHFHSFDALSALAL